MLCVHCLWSKYSIPICIAALLSIAITLTVLHTHTDTMLKYIAFARKKEEGGKSMESLTLFSVPNSQKITPFEYSGKISLTRSCSHNKSKSIASTVSAYLFH